LKRDERVTAMKNFRKAELAVVAVTLLILVFTAGFFAGRSSGAHVIRFDQLPSTPAAASAPAASAPAASAPAASAPAASAAPGVAASPGLRNEPGANASPAATAAAGTASVSAPAGLLNINTATLAELDALPGIGQVLAGNIVEYRQKAGGFKSIQQLMDVEGIGEKKLEAVKNLITVG
jgi:competence protein ComEA